MLKYDDLTPAQLAGLKTNILVGLEQGNLFSDLRDKFDLSAATLAKMRREDPAFDADYELAREAGYDTIADEVLRIADTPRYGQETVDGMDGETLTSRVETREMLGHRKLQVMARLKLLEKWAPKRYGALIGVVHSADDSLGARLSEALAHLDAKPAEETGDETTAGN